jgi:hypothetical protein
MISNNRFMRPGRFNMAVEFEYPFPKDPTNMAAEHALAPNRAGRNG